MLHDKANKNIFLAPHTPSIWNNETLKDFDNQQNSVYSLVLPRCDLEYFKNHTWGSI